MSINAIDNHQEAIKNLKDGLFFLGSNQNLKNLLDRVKFGITNCDFGAYTDPSKNKIFLDPSLFQGTIPSSTAIESALFELINLSKKRDFCGLVKKIDALDPDEFVKEYESIEYRTALVCKRILQKNIASDRWDAYPMTYTSQSFQLHYLLQQLSGHSQKIYERYKDHFNANQTYHGSWQAPTDTESKEILLELLNLKIGSETSETDFGKTAAASYKRLKNGLLSNPYYNHLTAYIQIIESVIPLPSQRNCQ